MKVAAAIFLCSMIAVSTICCGFVIRSGEVVEVNTAVIDTDKICLESFELYDDKEFKKLLPDDHEYVEKARKRLAKYFKYLELAKKYPDNQHYVAKAKEKMDKLIKYLEPIQTQLKKHELEVVQCESHPIPYLERDKEKQPDLKDLRLDKNPPHSDDVMHLKMRLAHSTGATLTLYIRVELYYRGELLFHFYKEATAGMDVLLSEDKSKAALEELGAEIAKTLVDKVNEYRDKK